MEFELVHIILGIVGTLMGAIPALARYRTKINQVKALFVALDEAMSDDKLTTAEIKLLIRQGRELIGTKKV